MRAALALLGRALSADGLALACPAPAGGGFGANFRIDGGATLRVTSLGALQASDGLAALARLGRTLDAARADLAALRAALDVLVGLLASAAALSAALNGPGGAAVLHVALVSVAYAALVPCRRLLLRLAFRGLMRAALSRIDG